MNYPGYRPSSDDAFDDFDAEDVIAHALDDDEVLNICVDCNGSGEGRREGSTCPYCRGRGTL